MTRGQQRLLTRGDESRETSSDLHDGEDLWGEIEVNFVPESDVVTDPAYLNGGAIGVRSDKRRGGGEGRHLCS